MRHPFHRLARLLIKVDHMIRRPITSYMSITAFLRLVSCDFGVALIACELGGFVHHIEVHLSAEVGHSSPRRKVQPPRAQQMTRKTGMGNQSVGDG